MYTTVATISERLKKAMAIRGMRQVDLVNSTGIPKGSISQYIMGYAEPKSDRIYALAKVLSVNPVWLMGMNVPMDKEELSQTYSVENAQLLMDTKDNPYLLALLKQISKLNDKQQKLIGSLVQELLSK